MRCSSPPTLFIISPLAPIPPSRASSRRALACWDFCSACVLTLSELCFPYTHTNNTPRENVLMTWERPSRRRLPVQIKVHPISVSKQFLKVSEWCCSDWCVFTLYSKQETQMARSSSRRLSWDEGMSTVQRWIRFWSAFLIIHRKHMSRLRLVSAVNMLLVFPVWTKRDCQRIFKWDLLFLWNMSDKLTSIHGYYKALWNTPLWSIVVKYFSC